MPPLRLGHLRLGSDQLPLVSPSVASRHRDKVEAFRRAVLQAEGAELSPATRARIVDGEAIDGPLGPFVERVRREAHAITDAEVEALRRTGVSEDAIFEATVAAALGVGLARLDLALRALEQAAP